MDDSKRSALADAKRNYDKSRADRSSTFTEKFHKLAHKTSVFAGTPWAFTIAVSSVILWAFTKPLFKNADTWQLVINTSTTIVTFLMVFLIQNTQNRDARAIHLKLDELIRAKQGARNSLVDLEDCTDDELAQIEEEFKRLRKSESRRDESSTDAKPVRSRH